MKLPIALSNKHVHLSQADVDALFGEGYQLTPFKPLSQPGQYACEEKVTVVGPKGQQTMRVLGDVEGTPAFKLVGPKGEVECQKGIIVAARHIHMSLEDAEKFGVKDKDVVSVKTEGLRGLTFHNVLVRASEKFALEMHVDIEEGNAAGVKNGDLVELIK